MIESMREIIDRGYEINHKLLYINRFFAGRKEIYQVHCNYRPLEFSQFYELDDFDSAARAFLKIRKEYV